MWSSKNPAPTGEDGWMDGWSHNWSLSRICSPVESTKTWKADYRFLWLKILSLSEMLAHPLKLVHV